MPDEPSYVERAVRAVREKAGLDRLYQARPAAETVKGLGLEPPIDAGANRDTVKIPKFGEAAVFDPSTLSLAPADIARILASAQTYLTLITDLTPQNPTEVPPPSFITTWFGATFQYNGYINGKAGYWYLAPGEALTPGTPQAAITTPVTANVTGPVTTHQQGLQGGTWVPMLVDPSGFLQMNIAAQAAAQLTTDIGAGNAYAKSAQLPGSLVGGGLNIRALAGTDIPGRSWNLSASDVPAPTGGDLTSGLQVTKTTPLATPRGSPANLAPTSVPDGTGATVVATYAGAVAGTRIFFSVAASGPQGVATGITYVAIKGATSSVYYAMAMPGHSVQGWFDLATPESLQIEYANHDGQSHIFSASVYGVTA